MFGPYPRQSGKLPLNPFVSQERNKSLEEQINEGESLIGDLRDRLSLYIHKCSRIRDVEDDLALYFQNMSGNLSLGRNYTCVPMEVEQAFRSSLGKCSLHLNALADFEDFKVQRIQNRISKVFQIYYENLQKYRSEMIGINRFHLPHSLFNIGREVTERNNNLYQGNMMDTYGQNPNFYPQQRGLFGINGPNKPWAKGLGNNRMFMSQDDLTGRSSNNVQKKNMYDIEKMRIDSVKEVLLEFFATELFCCIKQLETLTMAYKDLNNMTDIPDLDIGVEERQPQAQILGSSGLLLQEIQSHQSSLKNKSPSDIINPDIFNQERLSMGYNLQNNPLPFQPRPAFMPSMFNGFKNYPPTSPYYFPLPTNPMMAGNRQLGFIGGIMDESIIKGTSSNTPGTGGFMANIASPIPTAVQKDQQSRKNVTFEANSLQNSNTKSNADQNTEKLGSQNLEHPTMEGSSGDYSTTESEDTDSSAEK